MNIHEDIRKFSEYHGPVEKVYVATDYYTGRKKYAFLHFMYRSSAKDFMEAYHENGFVINDQHLKPFWGTGRRRKPSEMANRGQSYRRVSRVDR